MFKQEQQTSANAFYKCNKKFCNHRQKRVLV